MFKVLRPLTVWKPHVRPISHIPPLAGLETPTNEDLVKQQLELDPNLEAFFDKDDVTNIAKDDTKDDFDTLLEASDLSFDDPEVGPVTMTTEEFVRKMGHQKSDHYTPEDLPSSFNVANFDKYIDFMHRGDVPTPDNLPNNATLESLVESELPLTVISRLHDPRLNLSIERYIYNHLPDPKKHLFAKRLVLYRNSQCIVMGKNQNPYKEINFHMANMLQVPILRRYSGGGTVVHDLGNVNFSFIADKEAFTRTGYTELLIDLLNGLVGKEYQHYEMPQFELAVNDKGDMISAATQHKVSGSAYQISKGRSLHHGTMLLNADLKMMSQLLKLSTEKRQSITDKCIKSIPSPVENVRMDPSIFAYSCLNAFSSTYGVPSFLKRLHYDNVDLFKFGSSECQVLKIDDLSMLPKEVTDEYNRFKEWEWIFGRTPKFSLTFDIGSLNVDLHVEKGVLKDMKLNRSEPELDKLTNQLGHVSFRSDEIAPLIKDASLRKAFVWNIDQGLDYKRLGIDK